MSHWIDQDGNPMKPPRRGNPWDEDDFETERDEFGSIQIIKEEEEW